jgi:microcystin-dependent protein
MKSSKVIHHPGHDGTDFSTVEDEIETLRTQAALGGQVPVGTVLDYAGTAAPTYWLLCYGQSLVRTDYAALFTAIGTTFGAADADHFSLPDCRGRVVAGQDDMGGSSANRLTGITNGVNGDTFGAAGGLESTTVAQANLPSVNFTVTDPGHAHTSIYEMPVTGVQVTAGAGNFAGTTLLPASSALVNSSVTGISVASGGSGTAINNVQPTIILNKIIYAGV